ncbi:MAG: GCN5-related N-acetyltransferase [Caulobacteraceae bacterium]|nr:GCN5-related N-acetyltransferase [Caulobacteraceae bacterium]
MATPLADLRVEPLGPQHDRAAFFSGALPLDRYFKTQAGQDARRNLAAPFVLLLPDGTIAGYYTLAATGIRLAEMPASVTRRLPAYPLIPAILLGRLAVGLDYRGAGYGRFLLADALHRALRSEIGAFAVVVDAKDDTARRFYEREAFLPLRDQPLKLYRPMADIAALFD